MGIVKGPRFAAFFENLSVNYFSFTSLDFADKFFNDKQIKGLKFGKSRCFDNSQLKNPSICNIDLLTLGSHC